EIIPPCIDAFSPKNQDLPGDAVDAILGASGIVADGAGGHAASFLRADGATARVERRAEVIQDAPLRGGEPFVVQVSRWDPLKDPAGVIRAFADFVPEPLDAHLVLAGPATDAVSDDPESEEVLAEVRSIWERLPASARARIHLVTL